MADAGDIYFRALSGIGNNLADAMQQYHREHQAYDQQASIADALSRLGVDPQGRITQIDPESKDKSIQPIVDPKAFEIYRTANHAQQQRNLGAMEAINRIGMAATQHAISARIEDASLSGQRTKQIMSQSETTFPLDVAQKKATTAHIEKLTNEEGKINVPGFGMMTPPQYSAHLARQERMDTLKKKSEPILNFENQLQNQYGLGIKDVVDASQPQQFTDPRGNKYTGTPFYNSTGQLVSSEDAGKKPDQTFVLAGPNKIPIPLLDKKTGLGWQQITGKAKGFSNRLDDLQNQQSTIHQQQQQVQAQQVISHLKSIDPSQMTAEDQAALATAKRILGQ